MTEARFELAGIAIQMLSAGNDDEPVRLPESATPILSAAIELILTGDGAAQQLDGLLRLARALELFHSSPGAADAIYRAIEASPPAMAALGIVSADFARERGLDAVRLLDAEPPKTAPKYDAPPPAGTQKLSSYLKHYARGVPR